MKIIKEIALKTERKLNEQTAEFNMLRDRSLVVAAYGVALISAIVTYINKFGENLFIILTISSILSLCSIAIMLYASFSKLLNRGMDSGSIKKIVENRLVDSFKKYYIKEISYNLESFEENRSMLKSLQLKLNFGLLTQAIITISYGIITYLNYL